ncbi:hypothetical protein GCM10010218_45140 [Streptomyces mashuensis]|uniref:DUF3574 domain-containing protein n=1 Tax=Streptomyces mashuensis TaxID=33904 RepID=A0A919B6I7_9ACTN|nr:DUF3574 domain-containing protein [Streptomyces mashuensis]GHF58780.1 hypothetical protein GCM10010218_45140 [Streptomyces mashuensis]
MALFRGRRPLVLASIALAAVYAVGAPFAGAVFAGAVGPVAAHASEPKAAQPFMETHLFFGTGRHNGAPPITDDQFRDFLQTYVTPRFPSGFTFLTGNGQWRDRQGSINQERSHELIVLYPRAEAQQRSADIEEIRSTYTRLYELESVGRADVEVRADF